MVDNLFVFGNGIGRALDNGFFDLTRALERSWDHEGLLTDKQKGLICSCLPAGVIEKSNPAPTNEEDLDILQQVLSACDTIKKIEQNADIQDAWLSEHGLGFPVAVRKYLHMAACYFHNRDELSFEESGNISLPQDFSQSLRQAILDKGAHVATLNYDDLLYEAFVGTDVFNRYKLRDGFSRGTFDIDRQKRCRKAGSEGWFLHLHGSPLFVTRGNSSKKLGRADLPTMQGVDSTHLVLTSIKHKRSVINASEILSAYWGLLEGSAKSVKNIVIIGYAGQDTHLNDILSRVHSDAKIRVVERAEGKEKKERVTYWKEKIYHSNIDVVLMPSILDFQDWVPMK